MTGNRRYGIFFKHKGLENLDMYKAVKSTGGFAVVDCVATGNLWNFGGEKSYDVTYINCYNSDNTDVDSSEFAIRFDEGSVRCSALNCDDANIFTDVSYDDNEEYNAIYWAQNNAIASGYTRTEFAPNDSCTRINALRFLYNLSRRAGDITFEEINTGIEDVDNDENKNTYADVVKWALDNKIISAEESFRPDEYITANEYLYMLWLYETGEDFDDTKSSEELYEDAFNWAISKGIVYESEFMEDVAVFNECTRGQAVTILCRYSYSLSKFPITYNLQGGTINGTENPSTYKSGEDTITLSNPTKEGYTFQGWIGEDYNNTSEDTTEGRNSYTKMNIDITENDTGAKLYTAFYTSNKYMISFDANGGTGTMEDEYFTYDKPQALLANAFTKEGYVFAGWTINADGTGTRYTDKQAISNLTANADEEITLYANWEDITYTVEHYLQNIDGTYPEEPINKSEPILHHQKNKQ